jgi:hypothetical protein
MILPKAGLVIQGKKKRLQNLAYDTVLSPRTSTKKLWAMRSAVRGFLALGWLFCRSAKLRESLRHKEGYFS